MEQYLECAQIIKSHGVVGGMVVSCECNGPEDFCRLKTLYLKKGNEFVPYPLESASPYKLGLLIKVKGIDSPEQVVAVRGKSFFANRDEFSLKEGEFFIADLIGLPAYDSQTGKAIGVLKEVVNQGGGDLYVLSREGKEDALIPANPTFIGEISLEKGIAVHVIEGLLS